MKQKKLTLTHRKLWRLCTLLAVAPLFPLSANPILNEDFSGLAGPLTARDGWVSRSDAIQLDGSGRAVLVGTFDGFAKRPVEIPPGTARIRLEAQVHFEAMPGGVMRNHHIVGEKQPAWIALGFMDNPSENIGLVAAKLSVTVSSDGETVSVGMGHSVGREEPVFGVHQTAGTSDFELALEYDFASGTATALLDGKPVLSGGVRLSPDDFAMVAFQLRRIAPRGGLLDLKVECYGNGIPHARAASLEPEKPLGSRINTEHERNRELVQRIDGSATPAKTLAALKEGWDNPPATYRPHTRWWWPGNAVTKEGLTWQLEQMKEQGFGGVEIMSFLNIYEKGKIEIDSPEFIEMVRHVVDECRRLGMYTSLSLGPGWGHGSSQTAEEDKAKVLVFSEMDVDGGRIETTLKLPDDTSYERQNPKQFEALVAVALNADGSPDPSRRIDLSTEVEGRRDWAVSPELTVAAELPRGAWRLVAFWTCYTYQKCAAENYEPRTWIIDHLSNRAAKNHADYMGGKYLHAFGADFGQTVDSIFGDSYEIRQDFSYWTTGLLERFEKEKGYDLRPYLPLMLYDGAPETPYIRYDIGHFLHVLGMEGITHGLSDWCAEAGVHMRQQPHYRFTTDIIAASGVFQRPETENTKRSFDPMFWHKLTTSGAWLYPSDEKKWVSAEAFTFINTKYRTSMEQIKQASDLFLRDGITQFYNHGYFYSPEIEIAPSRDLLWMNRISHVNTWWPWYRGLADYQARASFLSRQGRAEADVLVYAPYPTLWSERSEYPTRHVRDLAFGHLPKTLIANGYDFDFANDDLLLNHAEIQDGRLVINGYEYSVLILPRVLCLAPEILEKLERFVQAGGTVFALNTLPEVSDGWKNHEARDAQLAAASERLFATGGGERTVGQGKTWFMPECDGFEYLKNWAPGWLEPAPTPPLSPAYEAFFAALRSRLMPDFEMADKAQSDGLTFRRTVIGDIDAWFITNLQPHPRKTRVTLKTQGKEPQIWDAMDGSMRAADSFDFAPDGRVMLDVNLEPWESKFILLTPQGAVELPPERERIAFDDRRVVTVKGPWKVAFRGLGKQTADLTLNELKDWRELPGLENFAGMATYTQVFDLPFQMEDLKSAVILDLGEVCDVATVIVNGQEAGRVWMQPYRVDISDQVRPGANTLEVVVANRMWNHTAGLQEPKPIPEHLHAHYGNTWNQQYNGWNTMANQRRLRGNDRVPSGLIGPVEFEIIPAFSGEEEK